LFLTLGVYNNFNIPRDISSDTIIHIPKGSSLNTVAGILKKNKILNHESLFIWVLRLQGLGSNIQAGEFLIPAKSSLNKIIFIFTKGQTLQHQITFPEGFTSIQIIDHLNAEPLLVGKIASIPKEGSLLPETYNFNKGDLRSSLIKRMEINLNFFLDKMWSERPDDFILKSPQEALILASIIEKETGLASERPIIASVFLNRLSKNMRLQSDPTVIYGISSGKPLNRLIKQSDLDNKSPYNTYKIRGLPQGPISNPGKESLLSVFKPKTTDFLYFVANGLGGHAFSKTLGEHNINVTKWRKIEQSK
jgi:UPF0755 protein